jgi:hypothetical protein
VCNQIQLQLPHCQVGCVSAQFECCPLALSCAWVRLRVCAWALLFSCLVCAWAMHSCLFTWAMLSCMFARAMHSCLCYAFLYVCLGHAINLGYVSGGLPGLYAVCLGCWALCLGYVLFAWAIFICACRRYVLCVGDMLPAWAINTFVPGPLFLALSSASCMIKWVLAFLCKLCTPPALLLLALTLFLVCC